MAEAIEGGAGAGIDLLLPVDAQPDPLQDGDETLVDVGEEGADEADVIPLLPPNAGSTASHPANGHSRTNRSIQTGPSRHSSDDEEDGEEDSKLQLKVMLGTTVIGNSSAWAGEMESSLPYIERSVPISDEYESALIDEDIIVGLKVSVSQCRLG